MPSRTLSLYALAERLGATVSRRARPQHRYVVVNGLRLHYLDWGARGKPVVLLVHSGEEAAHGWDLTALAFCAGYHVLAIESRGFGDSERVTSGVYTEEDHVRDLEGFASALGLKDFVLVGEALGARHAHIFASLHPDMLRAVVIVDTAPEVSDEAVKEIRGYLTATSSVPTYAEFVRRLMAVNPRRPFEQVRAMLRHEVERRPDGSWTWKRDQRTVMGGRPPSAMDSTSYLWSTLRKITCPSLLVRGAESPILTEPLSKRMMGLLPKARLVVIPKAGHLVAGDNPVAFERALRKFLKDVAG